MVNIESRRMSSGLLVPGESRSYEKEKGNSSRDTLGVGGTTELSVVSMEERGMSKSGGGGYLSIIPVSRGSWRRIANHVFVNGG